MKIYNFSLSQHNSKNVFFTAVNQIDKHHWGNIIYHNVEIVIVYHSAKFQLAGFYCELITIF